MRLACRDIFRETKLVTKIIPDIRLVLGETGGEDEPSVFDVDEARPAGLWTPPSELEQKEGSSGG